MDVSSGELIGDLEGEFVITDEREGGAIELFFRHIYFIVLCSTAFGFDCAVMVGGVW